MIRTYRGPILVWNVELGVVIGNGQTYTDDDFALAVDDGSGEIVLLSLPYPCISLISRQYAFVCSYNPTSHTKSRKWNTTP